jgi:plasmid stabilization system protein ParE
MSLSLQRAEFFIADFKLQARWYVREGGEEVAQRYLMTLDSTLNLLPLHPALGEIRRFR